MALTHLLKIEVAGAEAQEVEALQKQAATAQAES